MKKYLLATFTLLLTQVSMAASEEIYSQYLKCTSIEGPQISFGRELPGDAVVINVLDDAKNPVWQVLGTHSPSDSFPVVLIGSSPVSYTEVLISEREVSFIGNPKFVIKNDEALVTSASFRLKGKIRPDLAKSMAELVKKAEDQGYSLESVEELKSEVLNLIDERELKTVMSEIQCSVQGKFK